MIENPYQAMVVGQEAVPKAKHYSKWCFLRELIKKIYPEQAIRLVLPKGCSVYGVRMAWAKYAGERKVFGESRRVENVDGTTTLYLWFIKDSKDKRRK